MSAGSLPPALVLGGDVTALGVVRSLGRKNIRQFGIGAGGFVRYSRWYRSLPGPTPDLPSPMSLAAFLDALPFDRLVLIPCSDAWAAAVAGLDARLTARFPASLAPREGLDVLVDKGRLAAALTHLGLPHPRTFSVRTQDDLATISDQDLRQGFLKPCSSYWFGYRFGIKALRVQSRAEAAAFLKEAGEAGLELVWQEYVPGPPTEHYFANGFVDRTGTVCGRLAYRRLRMFPTDFGNSSALVSVPLEAMGNAGANLERLLAALDFRGIFQAEFKRDPRDGLFKMLDVNARPFWQVGFVVGCGIDVCEMAYRDALELPVTPVTDYVVGRRWVYADFDRKACWALLRQGSLTPWGWFRSWAGATGPILSWDDPAPAVMNAAWQMGGLLRRVVRP